MALGELGEQGQVSGKSMQVTRATGPLDCGISVHRATLHGAPQNRAAAVAATWGPTLSFGTADSSG